MIERLIRSKTKRRLLHLFLTNPEGRFYLREIERLTGEAVGALSRQLKELEQDLFLSSERVGPLKYFALNKDYPYLSELQGLVLKDYQKGELEKNLRRILKFMKETYHPEKVILFGSLASGHVHPDSDLDLLIIKRDVPQRYWDRVNQLAPIMPERTVALDYVIWTPEEIEHETDNLFLQEEILKKGKVVYEKTA